MEPLFTNPAASVLGRVNAILTGRSCQYAVKDFAGPLSVKSVISGSAVWQTGRRRTIVYPGSALILNDGEAYSLEIDSRAPVETFCVFFRQGFVEDASRVARETTDALLEDPWRIEPVLLRPDGAVMRSLAMCRSDAETGVFALAETLAGLRRLPSVKLATRDELLKRVLRGRDFIEASLGRSLRLDETARAACLSLFHFHRAFKSVFGEPPHQYLARRRLELAAMALESSDEPITSIALRCGFETPSAFTIAFRKRFGASPSTIRKNGQATASGIAR